MAVALSRKGFSKDRVLTLASAFADRFVADSIFSRAASLAYYTTLSIAPFTVVMLICLALLGPDIVGVYTREVTRFLGPEAGGVFVTAVASTKQRPDIGTVAGILSVLTLLVSASAVFGELRETLTEIHRQRRADVAERTWGQAALDFLKLRVLNAGLVLGFIFILITSLIMSSVISAFSDILPKRFEVLINYLGSGAAYVVTFTLLSRYVPTSRLPWRDAFRGGLITAVFFLIGKELISSYLGSSSAGTAYGAAGSLVLFLLWVYYSATILFACAVLNDLLMREPKDAARSGPAKTRSRPVAARGWRSWIRRPAFLAVALAILVLVAARASAPILIRDRLNGALASNEKSIGGYVEDVDLALFRGAYRVEGLHLFLVDGKERLPVASAAAIDISVAWRDLFRGRVRADVDLESPRVMLEPMGRLVRDLARDLGRGDPEKVTKTIVPFKVERVRVDDGSVDSGLLAEGEIKPLLRDLMIRATGIYDSNHTGDRTSSLEAAGRVVDGGDVAVQGEFHRAEEGKPATWKGRAKLERLPLRRLNPLLLDLVPLSFTAGRLTAETSVEARGTADLKGEVKTTFEGVDVISSAESWKGPKHALFEIGSAIGFVLTKAPKDKATVATFGFERKDGKFGVEYGEAIGSAIQHRLKN